MIRAWLVVLGLLCPLVSLAETFHVSVAGSDTNPGTAAQPFRTVQRAQTAVRQVVSGGLTEDVRVAIGAGTYVLTETLAFDIRDSGTDRFAVVYEAADPENRPILTGGRSVTGTWTSLGSDLWSIPVPEVASGDWWFRDLYKGNDRQIRSREPDFDFEAGVTFGPPTPANDPDYPDWTRPIAGAPLPVVTALLAPDRTSFEVSGPAFPDVLDSDNAEIVTVGPWSSTRARVSGAKSPQIRTRQRPGAEGFHFADLMLTRPLFLEHARAFLDTEGEWFLDRTAGTLFYQSASDPNGADFWAPNVERLIEVAGTASQPMRRFELRNLILQGSNWTLPAGEYPGTQAHFFRPNGLTSAVPLPEAVRFRYVDEAVVRGCLIRGTGASGLAFGRGCRHGAVAYCTFDDIGGTAIALGENSASEKLGDDTGKAIGLRAVHNTISRFGRIQFGAVGIWVAFVPDAVIEYNDISDGAYTGISIGWDWTDAQTRQRNCSVRYNHVHNVMKWHDDGSGIYAVGRQEGTRIAFNRVHDVKNGNGLQFDKGTSGLVAENNLIYRVGKHGVACNMGYDRVVRNNIFLDAGESLIHLRQIGFHPGKTVVTFQRNIYRFSDFSNLIGRGGNQSLFDMNVVFEDNLYYSTTGDPLLVDNGRSFVAWQADGHDMDSHADVAPGFLDAAHDNYSLTDPTALATLIGFENWDQSVFGPQPAEVSVSPDTQSQRNRPRNSAGGAPISRLKAREK